MADPSPDNLPIVSYVLSRIPHTLSFKLKPPSPSATTTGQFDVEAPPVPVPPPAVAADAAQSAAAEAELLERMPGLRDPPVLAAMSRAVSGVAQARAVLAALGDRPDHEAVDAARSQVAAFENGEGSSTEAGANPKVIDGLKALLRLDEMHEAYGKLLRDAEERLEKVYRAASEGIGLEDVNGNGNGKGEFDEADEEVIRILQGAEGKGLEKIDLSHRQLKHLPEAFGRLRGLLYLDVSNNNLEILPDALGGLDCLEELHASANVLTALPDTIGLLSRLKVLVVSGNKLRSLPDSICHCRSLIELDVSYNDLTYLPTNIGYELVNLQKLLVHLNKLRSLPSSVCEMISLRILDAHYNELRSLPHSIGKLTNLEILNASRNFSDLKELPASLGDMINLRELDLSNNQIDSLPDTFGHLEKLEVLNLEQNPLEVPPPDVVSQGVTAIRTFMAKRFAEKLRAEEEKSAVEAAPQSPVAWLTRSMSSLVSGVSDYLGGRDSPKKEAYLNEQY